MLPVKAVVVCPYSCVSVKRRCETRGCMKLEDKRMRTKAMVCKRGNTRGHLALYPYSWDTKILSIYFLLYIYVYSRDVA